jgi:hypothetical protein
MMMVLMRKISDHDDDPDTEAAHLLAHVTHQDISSAQRNTSTHGTGKAMRKG